MIQGNISNYKTHIDKILVEQFLHMSSIDSETWKKIQKIILSFEEYLCLFFHKIISECIISTDIDIELNEDIIDHLNLLIWSKKSIGPLIQFISYKNCKLVYKAGSSTVDTINTFLILTFLKEKIENPEISYKDFVTNFRILTSWQYDQNFKINMLQNIVSQDDIKHIFSEHLYNKYKFLINFYIDVTNIIIQQYILGYFLFYNEGEVIINSLWPVSAIEEHIKDLISQNRIPGPFIKIQTIEKKNDNYYIVKYAFGKNLNKDEISDIISLLVVDFINVLFYGNTINIINFLEQKRGL